MITALCDDRRPATASARKSSGSASPPMASPPILKNDRRVTPSQNRCPRPNIVSMDAPPGMMQRHFDTTCAPYHTVYKPSSSSTNWYTRRGGRDQDYLLDLDDRSLPFTNSALAT